MSHGNDQNARRLGDVDQLEWESTQPTDACATKVGRPQSGVRRDTGNGLTEGGCEPGKHPRAHLRVVPLGPLCFPNG